MLHKIMLHTNRDAALLSPYQNDPAQRKKIVIIDDSQTVRKIVQICLGRKGFEVQGFHDGVEALRWLSQRTSSLPDLVILDVGLPKLDGYKIARYLRRNSQFRHIAIIMLTMRGGIADRFKGRLAGAQEYLTKPFTTQTLISRIETLLGVPMPPEI